MTSAILPSAVTDTIMRAQMQSRLNELRKELEIGQARIRELEGEDARLRETMLRISGAIQVLTELLAEPEENNKGSPTEEIR